MAVMNPYQPISLIESGNSITANVSMRKITFGEDSLIKSIIADGEELFSAPMRIIGAEDGEPLEWKMKDSFVFSRSDEEVTVCGSMQSELFIINTSIVLGYDGCMNFDLKIMPKGKTVAEDFGLNRIKKHDYKLESLVVEVPLKKNANLYHIYPASPINGENGTLVPLSDTSCSGELPLGKEKRCFIPHRPLLWFGNEKRGLCFFSESDENWQPEDKSRAIEICDTGDTRLLRIHLLDSHPHKWVTVGDKAPNYSYKPLSFSLGFEATPIKPFPKQPYLHNALHIDCFCKIAGDYKEYLYGDFGGENGYDRIKRLGVTTLVLHEKWNKMQNFPYLSEPTADQLETIIRECHSRGIKVIPYFGYEMSTLSPLWSERCDEAIYVDENGEYGGGWWRVPPQRAYVVCYGSSWQDTFVAGIKNLIEKYDFDGIYLDTTFNVKGCINEKHGCGYIGEDGKRKPTYPLMENRRMLKRLYEIVEARGGIINYHSWACVNIPSMGFAHIGWNGENIQMKLLNEGAQELPLDYFRAEYIGRNFGVPQELIAYENRPRWSIEHACAYSIIHGILPRPNSIGEPLEFMSNVWRVFNAFPIRKSEWVPYWGNDEITTGDGDIKCSFYRYRDEFGSIKRLIFAANTKQADKKLSLNIDAELKFGTMKENGEMPPFSFGIFIG